jgi:glyoxylase I family protein
MTTIEHVAIYAADAPRLKDFYVEAFGMKVVSEGKGDPPGFFLVDDDDFAIEIIGRPAGQTGVNQRYVCHLAFWVDDYASARAELERRGIVFETDTAVDNDQIKTAFFNDPEANRLQIVWREKRLGE